MTLRPPSTRAFTLVEAMIALVIIMVGFWAFYEVVVRTSDANDYAMAFTSLAATTQVAVNDIREDASVAKLVFRNNTVGQGYLAAVAFPSEFPLLETAGCRGRAKEACLNGTRPQRTTPATCSSLRARSRRMSET